MGQVVSFFRAAIVRGPEEMSRNPNICSGISYHGLMYSDVGKLITLLE